MTQSVAGSVLALVVIGCAGSAQAQESKIGSKQPPTPNPLPFARRHRPHNAQVNRACGKYIQILKS